MYLALMDTGLTQTQIDELDIVRHINLLAHRRDANEVKESESKLTIDQVLG